MFGSGVVHVDFKIQLPDYSRYPGEHKRQRDSVGKKNSQFDS